MIHDKQIFHSLQSVQFSLLTKEAAGTCAGCLVHADKSRLSCLSKYSLETGSPVVMTFFVNKYPHELLGRVTACESTENGEYLLKMGMEYTDLETQRLLEQAI